MGECCFFFYDLGRLLWTKTWLLKLLYVYYGENITLHGIAWHCMALHYLTYIRSINFNHSLIHSFIHSFIHTYIHELVLVNTYMSCILGILQYFNTTRDDDLIITNIFWLLRDPQWCGYGSSIGTEVPSECKFQ